MMPRTEVLAIQPRTMRVRTGWLAVSEPGSALVIGVEAESETEAVERFTEALQRWASWGDESLPASAL